MKTAFAFDLDGTVTKEELLPLISKEIDLFEEISLLTELTMNSVIPFDASFKLRFAILKSIKVSTIQNIVRKATLNEGIVNFIRNNHDDCYIVTGNIDKWVEPITSQLHCKVYSSLATEREDYLSKLVKINDKSSAIADLRHRYDRIIAIGEGANDIPMFKSADITICYGGVHQPDKNLLSYANHAIYDEEKVCALLNTFL